MDASQIFMICPVRTVKYQGNVILLVFKGSIIVNVLIFMHYCTLNMNLMR